MRHNTYEIVWEVLSKGNELLKEAKSLFSTIILCFTLSSKSHHVFHVSVFGFALIYVVWFLFLRSVGMFQSFGSLFCFALFQKCFISGRAAVVVWGGGSRPVQGRVICWDYLLCCFSVLTKPGLWYESRGESPCGSCKIWPEPALKPLQTTDAGTRADKHTTHTHTYIV